jgi:hypothetical protein
MVQQINLEYGRAVVAMRQAEFENQARRNALIRTLKRARRADRALGAQPSQRDPVRAARPAGACGCATDLG